MAGRSQASNLTGMLSGIGDTIGQMGEPGRQYVDTFRRSMAPKPDMSSASSLEEYAQWARRNGYDEEADKYMALSYKQKEVEKQEAKDKALGNAMVEAGQAGALGERLGSEGFTDGVDQQVAKLNGMLEKHKDNPAVVEQIQNQINALSSRRDAYKVAADDENARRVVELDKHISNLNKDDPNYSRNKAALDKVRADILARGDAETAYQTKKLDLMELENKQNTAMWQKQSSAIIQEIRAAGTDATKLEAVSEKHSQFAAQIAMITPDLVAHAERMEKLASEKMELSQVDSMIDDEKARIADSTLLTEDQKRLATERLDALRESKDRNGGIYPAQVITQAQGVFNSISRMEDESLSSKANIAADRAHRAELRYEKAVDALHMPLDRKDVIGLAEVIAGKDWEDMKDDERATFEAQARQEMMFALESYAERTAIAAGYQEPYSLDAADKKAARGLLESGVPEDRVVFRLISEGYRKEDVVALIKEFSSGGKNQLTLPQAEQYYNEILAEVEVNDERVAQIVEERRKQPTIPAPTGNPVRARGGRTVDPNAVSDDHATRTRERLSNPQNLWQGITLSESPANKLREARDKQNAGDGFRYPDLVLNSSRRKT
jgi:hypothetical protein